MKADRLNSLVTALALVLGALALSTGHLLVSVVMFLMAFVMYWNRGGGGINERSIFENEVKSSRSIAEVYELLKDMDTPLGRAWLAEHRDYPGESIVFGPGPFKDCIVISGKSSKLIIKHITKFDKLTWDAANDYRFSDLLNTKEIVVDPRNYSLFARDKLLSVMMIRHIREMLTETAGEESGGDTLIPSSIDMVNFYYHNSSEGWFKDEEGRNILRVENSYNPFTAKLYNEDGEEMASVEARRFDKQGHAAAAAGFDIFANGEQYGEIYPYKDKTRSGYIVGTDDGGFLLTLFPACRRANISCNYRVEKEGELKAVIGGSPRLVFNDVEERQNDLVLSYDDDYLVLYTLLEVFIMTYNSSFLK